MLFKVRPERADSEVQNLIIIALKSETPANLKTGDAQLAGILDNLYDSPLALTEKVLTDELAPVEYYNSFAQTDYQR